MASRTALATSLSSKQSEYRFGLHSTKCYSVTITEKVPLTLSKVVGFRGNTTLVAHGSYVSLGNSIQGSSIATSASAYKYCIVALGTSGVTDITSNGAPKANLGGCNVASNAGATCNGSNLNAGIVDAHGTDNGCGTTQNSNRPVVTDPYAKPLPLLFQTDSCNSIYPQEPTSKNSADARGKPMGRHLQFKRLQGRLRDQQLTATRL